MLNVTEAFRAAANAGPPLTGGGGGGLLRGGPGGGALGAKPGIGGGGGALGGGESVWLCEVGDGVLRNGSGREGANDGGGGGGGVTLEGGLLGELGAPRRGAEAIGRLIGAGGGLRRDAWEGIVGADPVGAAGVGRKPTLGGIGGIRGGIGADLGGVLSGSEMYEESRDAEKTPAIRCHLSTSVE